MRYNDGNYMKRNNLAGVTIPELLIGLLVIGIVIAIFVYALGVQRATSRDSKRISDISVMRASLSQFWLQKASYPPSDGVSFGQPGSGAERLGGNGQGYSLRFVTERATAYGPAGMYYGHSSGVDKLDEIK